MLQFISKKLYSHCSRIITTGINIASNIEFMVMKYYHPVPDIPLWFMCQFSLYKMGYVSLCIVHVICNMALNIERPMSDSTYLSLAYRVHSQTICFYKRL